MNSGFPLKLIAERKVVARVPWNVYVPTESAPSPETCALCSAAGDIVSAIYFKHARFNLLPSKRKDKDSS